MMIALLLALFPSSLCALDGEIQDTNMLVRYDLRPATPRHDAGTRWKESLVPDQADPRSTPAKVHHQKLYALAPPEIVLDVVTRILGDELLAKGRTVTLDGESSLLVHAPAQVHERIQSVLETLGRALSSAERVRMDVFSIPAGGADLLLKKTSLTVQEADQLASLAGPDGARRTLVLDLLPGRTTVVDQMRSTPVMSDFDVEISQGAFAFDPVVVDVEQGLRVLARGARTGSGVALSLVFTSHRLEGAVTERALQLRAGVAHAKDGGFQYVSGPTTLQSADVQTRSVAFSTVLPADRVVAFATETTLGGGQALEVVTLRREGGNGSPFYSKSFGSVTLMLVNSEVFGLPSFAFEGDPNPFGELGHHPTLAASLSSEPPGFLFDWLKFRFSVWRRIGPWAVVVTDPAWDNQAGRELEQLFTSLDATAELTRLEAELRDRDDALLARVSLPVLAGTKSGVVLGRSSSYLADYDVEVAQFATAADPVIAPLFEGLVAKLGVSRGAQRFLEASGSGQRLRLPIGGRDPSAAMTSPFTGPVESVTVDGIEFDEGLVLGPSGTLTVGATSSKGADPEAGLHLSITVR